jgi:hypothetical protein
MCWIIGIVAVIAVAYWKWDAIKGAWNKIGS